MSIACFLLSLLLGTLHIFKPQNYLMRLIKLMFCFILQCWESVSPSLKQPRQVLYPHPSSGPGSSSGYSLLQIWELESTRSRILSSKIQAHGPHFSCHARRDTQQPCTWGQLLPRAVWLDSTCWAWMSMCPCGQWPFACPNLELLNPQVSPPVYFPQNPGLGLET